MKTTKTVTFKSLSKMVKTADTFLTAIEMFMEKGYSIDNWHNKYGYNRKYINKYDNKGNKVQLGFLQIDDSKHELSLTLIKENISQNEYIIDFFKAHSILKELVN